MKPTAVFITAFINTSQMFAEGIHPASKLIMKVFSMNNFEQMFKAYIKQCDKVKYYFIH